MINLLPVEERRQLKAARANTLLVRYVIITIVVVLVLLGMVGAVRHLLAQQFTAAEQRIADNLAKTTSYQEVQNQADALRSSLDSAKGALASDIHYSNALLNIAAALPSNVTVKSLSLDAQSLGQEMTLETTVDSEEQAYAIKKHLDESEFVVPGSVKYGKLIAPADSNSGYTLQLLVTFKKEIAQ